MIPTSTDPAHAIRWSPPWIKPPAAVPVFLLRAGTVLERELMEAELAGQYQAGTVWPWEEQAAIVSGLRALGKDDAEQLLALAEADFAGAIESDAERMTYRQALDVLAAHWPPYQRLQQQRAQRNAVAPIVAFRRFCCGWENVDAAFGRGIDQLVTIDALNAIAPLTLRSAGLRAYNLQYGGGEEKNSDAPSKSGDGPGTSNMGANAAKAGKSRASATRKTRASRSRAGRSSS